MESNEWKISKIVHSWEHLPKIRHTGETCKKVSPNFVKDALWGEEIPREQLIKSLRLQNW